MSPGLARGFFVRGRPVLARAQPPGYKPRAPPALTLAQPYRPGLVLGDYWVSEKYDGIRAYWNGQQFLSRQGLPIEALPGSRQAGLPTPWTVSCGPGAGSLPKCSPRWHKAAKMKQVGSSCASSASKARKA